MTLFNDWSEDGTKRVGHPRGYPRKLLKRKSLQTNDTALLSRGSQVRVLPGALFLKNSATSPPLKLFGEHKSKKVTGLASSRQNTTNSDRAISRMIRMINKLQASAACAEIIVTSGHECRRSLDDICASHRIVLT